MDAKRWQAIKKIYNSTLSLPPGERESYLKRACLGDDALEREVKRLLAGRSAAESLFGTPAMEMAGVREGSSDGHSPSLEPSLLHYRVIEKIGAGGMGEVYRAEDSKLGRQVAIKLLPEIFSGDPERRARFEREARLLASLNHPSIASIYGFEQTDGRSFLVLELVEGETLEQRIAKGPLPVEEALRVCGQIAEGMEAAHEDGVIHRDLKPANVMITPKGKVKILDLGLAKAAAPETESADPTRSPTITEAMTRPGVIFGTAAYMSPEQARGKVVDKQTDIWALGCILFECLTATRAFPGDTVPDTIACILSRDPDWTLLPKSTPPAIRKLLVRSLRRHPSERLHDISDARIEIYEALASASDHYPAKPAPHMRVRVWAIGLAVAFTAALAGWWLLIGPRSPLRSPPAARATVSMLAAQAGIEWCPAFSPDGKQIAFAWNGASRDNYDIYVQLIDEATPSRLTVNPALDFSPVWSPDGLRIAFLRETAAGTEVFIVPIAGGAERRLHVSTIVSRFGLRQLARQFCGLAWSPDGKFLAIVDKESPQAPNSIFLLDVDTRETRKLTTPPADWYGDGLSVFSPDGRTLAFARSLSVYPSEIYVLELSEDAEPRGEPRPLTRDHKTIWGFDWTADGRTLVFASDRDGIPELWRVAATGGEPERLSVGGYFCLWPAISRKENRIAYVQATMDYNIWRVATPGAGVSLEGAPVKITHSPWPDISPAFSADGSKFAYASATSGEFSIWASGSDGSRPVRLAAGLSPQWSPDGRRIVFFRGPVAGTRIPHMFWVDAEGGSPHRLTRGDIVESFPRWSQDGKWIYFSSNQPGLWKVPADGGTPVLAVPGIGRAIESVDGNFFFYSASGQIWRIPVAGGEPVPMLKKGNRALWTPAASGIYVLDPDTEGGPAIQYFPFAAGRPAGLVRLGGEPDDYIFGLDTLSVSPDERWILYGYCDRNEADIVMVDHFR